MALGTATGKRRARERENRSTVAKGEIGERQEGKPLGRKAELKFN